MAQQTIHVDDYDRESNKNRFRILMVIIITAFTLLAIRLVDLQLLKGKHLEKMSRAQKLRTIELEPIRGDILDRNDAPLAVTKQGFELLLYADPSTCNFTDLAGSVAELLEMPREEIEKRFEERNHVASFQPTVILNNLTNEQVAALEENLTGLDCLEVVSVPFRYYPHGSAASQLIGYMGEVTGKEVGMKKDSDYAAGDLIGRMGLEQGWEDVLRGKKGKEMVVVDSTGRRNTMFERELRLPPVVEPEPGKNIELTIDLDLQKACEKALGDNVGAVVIMDVNTGEILAMASSPGFDPNSLTGKIDPEEWNKLVMDTKRPFFNRSVQGEYPPGSVFKIVPAAAGLETGAIGPYTTVECKGVVELGANRDLYHCWNTYGHENVDFYRSLVESCDIYYYRLGERLGINVLRDYAHKFGLGVLSGMNLPGEKVGVIPEPLWKKRVIGKSWYLGDTVITAIGQGYTLLTPLQVTRMMSVIANGGKSLKPYIVRRVLTHEGGVVEEFMPEVEIPRVVDPEVCSRIRDALVGVVNDPQGTAYGWLGKLPVKVAGKTGTAQVIARSKKKEFMLTMGEIPWEYRDHAWFVAFLPAYNPKIAITVMIEHGGAGGETAGPICGEIIRYYYYNLYRQARSGNGGA